MTTRLPSAMQPRPSPRSDPRASPSGRTWQAIRILLAVRIALAARRRGLWFMLLGFPQAGEQLVNARAAFDGGIDAELDRRVEAEVRAPAELPADEPRRAVQSLQRRRHLLGAAQRADEDARRPQVGADLRVRHRDEPDARV